MSRPSKASSSMHAGDLGQTALSKGDTVSALERGIAVLRCFSRTDRVLSNTELSERTGIPKPTVTRLAATLVSLGLLRQNAATESFELAAGVVSMAQAFLSGLDVRARARPHMQTLADLTGGTVLLAVRDGLEMVLIEVSRPRMSMISSTLDVGSRVPLPNSALGRAYLAGVDERERAQLIETLHLSRGSEWPRLLPGLDGALAEAGRCGYAGSFGEWHREIGSLATPIQGPNGEVMALNCGGPAFAFNAEKLHGEVAKPLLATAASIAQDIGGSLPLSQSLQRRTP